jgi:hypothetical protein
LRRLYELSLPETEYLRGVVVELVGDDDEK